jgi:hypothetical protein
MSALRRVQILSLLNFGVLDYYRVVDHGEVGMAAVTPLASRLDGLAEEPQRLNTMSSQELFDIEWPDVQSLQLEVLRRRFHQMRPRIRVLERLAADLGITDLRCAEDATALFLPHTLYKSYSLSAVEQGRYDRLTQWFAGLTSVDLSGIDTSECDSLESWLDLLEAQTTLRPVCSSGTTGKISVFPRTTREETYRLNNFLDINGRYRDEPDSGLVSGEVDYFCPWPVATGRHNMPTFFKMLQERVYRDKPGEHVHLMGNGHWDVDMLWLSGRLRSAEAKGELSSLKLTPAMQRMRERMAQLQSANGEQIDAFVHKLFVEYRDRRVFLFAPFLQMIPLAQECLKRGLDARFAPDSYVLTGGRSGSKGVAFPEGWMELCKRVFPFPYQEVFGMTESSAAARMCPAGYFHVPPWIAMFLLDPDTSAPYERTGIKTGRYALFDLLPTSFWGGFITGDRITINWDGGCTCGRKGPYIHSDIVRYGNLRDDDKITCSKSPDAYEKAVELTLGAVFS